MQHVLDEDAVPHVAVDVEAEPGEVVAPQWHADSLRLLTKRGNSQTGTGKDRVRTELAQSDMAG